MSFRATAPPDIGKAYILLRNFYFMLQWLCVLYPLLAAISLFRETFNLCKI